MDYPEAHKTGAVYAQRMSTATTTRKDLGSAYLFAVLLAPASAHRIYLGDWPNALLQAGLWWAGWFIVIAGQAMGLPGVVGLLGILAIIGAFIWWVLDLCLMPAYVRAANASPAA